MSAIHTSCFPDVLLPSNKIVDFAQTKEPAKLFQSIDGMYGLAIQALEYLKEGKLEEFDSLATDCSCHLRALKIVSIVKELMHSTSSLSLELEKTLKDLKTKRLVLQTAGPDHLYWCQKGKKINGTNVPIVSALQALKVKSQKDCYIFPVQDALKELNVKSDIATDLAYAIHAYILKLVKDFRLVEESDKVTCADSACNETISSLSLVKKEVTILKKLSDSVKLHSHGEINVGLIEKDVYKLAKKHLTDLSVDFLLQETFKFQNQQLYWFLKLNQKMVADKIELPDFYSLTGTFEVCLQKQIPVLLKVKKCLHAHRYQEPDNPFDVYVYLTPNKHGTSFDYGSFLDLVKEGPLVVVEGKRSGKDVAGEPVTHYVQRLLKGFNFMDVCEMDGAQHKQYTSDEDSLLQKPSEVISTLKSEMHAFEAKRLDELREKAETIGCAFSNQKLLILSHIFADSIKNQQMKLQHQLKNAQLIQYDPSTEIFISVKDAAL